MSDELPQGWVSSQVSELIEDFQPGFASGEKNVEGGVAHLRMNNIGLVGELVLDLVRTVPEKLAKPRHDLLPGDVLVCTTNSGALVGKCAIFDLPGRFAFSNHLTRLRPKRDVIDGRFLRWNLWLHWKRGVFDDKCKHWVNQSTLPKDALLETEISVPPLAEQRRIVAKLEQVLGKVESCQRRLAKIPVLLKRFRQSVLAAACSGRLTADWREENGLTLERDWKETELRDICSSITDGDHLPPPKQPSGVPFLTIGNISSGYLDFSETRFVAEEYFRRIKTDRLPKIGDVLYTVVGATIGIPVLVNVNREFCFQRHIAILKPSKTTASKFLWMLMSSPEVFHEAWERVTGTAQPTLPLGNLRAIPVRVPPFAEQQEIVRRVEALFALAEKIEARYAKAQAQVDRLTPSLLARAFAGKLVPQDPADEPAAVLLERIRARKDGPAASAGPTGSAYPEPAPRELKVAEPKRRRRVGR